MTTSSSIPSAVVIAVDALESAAARADAAAAAETRSADVADEGKVKVFLEGEERVCRICLLSPDWEAGEVAAELMTIGCACKSDLGAAHRDCAETWFRLKGNRCCEICNTIAKNIKGEEDGGFMEWWHDGTTATTSSSHRDQPSENVGCWRGQPFCNFLMACLVIAFILPWFFRVNMF